MRPTISASAGHSTAGRLTTGSTVALVADDVLQVREERRLVGARQRADVDLRLAGAGMTFTFLPA